MSATAAQIEIYWMPGCSSCLRLKEFVEKTGKPYVAINVEAEPARAGKLTERGMRVPALCVGDRCVNGVHLPTVAELIGVDYAEPDRLSPTELVERYRRVIEVLRAVVPQITPDVAKFALPGRERTLIEVAGHAGCVMRYFLGKYDDDDHPKFFDDLEPQGMDAAALDGFIAETAASFESWAAEAADDPLDTVVPLYWGHRPLHEGLEREVWHTAQHTRQVIFMLEQSGVTPNHRLSPEDLAGLPLPERVFD
ncbi:DinB family protein [Microbacterium sp. NPDC078428]|uniref:DinB family protein n=1 Tax=Microbacterium sp. NPDC078428 TaxID=3364190 RepID=UPI0037C87048